MNKGDIRFLDWQRMLIGETPPVFLLEVFIRSPGNPTRSYWTEQPLKIIGEITEGQRQTPEQLEQWREKSAANNGEIIN